MKKTLFNLFIIAGLIFFKSQIGFAAASEPPYYAEIMNSMRNLEYSGFPALIKPEVSLSLNFKERTWTVHNIHKFGEDGLLMLEGGRYGLCSELAAYVYTKLKTILNGPYIVNYVMVKEPGFFMVDESAHMILSLFKQDTMEAFYIDPSFHKYGRRADFEGYLFLDAQPRLSFIENKITDISFKVDQAMPIFLKNDIVISFSVASVDGLFDSDNFLLTLTRTVKNAKVGQDIMVVGKYRGKFQAWDEHALVGALLQPEEIRAIYNKLLFFVEQVDPSINYKI
ncbi:MAG: hypothetical protein HQL25_00375 [Candidatus Omnitrophica bacterium]|nr:hypothetical protein [Candidatus Omnitrophota bacterium]